MIGQYGTFDDDLYRAKILEKQLGKAGVPQESITGLGADDLNIEKLRGVEGAIPALHERLWSKMTFQDPKSTKDIAGEISKATGLDVGTEQAQKLIDQRRGAGSYLRQAKDLAWGEAPLRTIGQRFQYGGLVGKGGVLTADLAPNVALRRQYKGIADAARKGRYGQALRGAAWASPGTAGYLGNVAFNYGLPALGGYEAVQAARDSGESPVRAAGAALTGGVANVVAAPLGLVQWPAYEPAMSGISKLWGVAPDSATATAYRGATEGVPAGRSAAQGTRKLIPQIQRAKRLGQHSPMPFPTSTG